MIRLVVLYGGQSAEHEVSCISAYNAIQAADRARYEIRLLGITSDGRWVDGTPALSRLDPAATALPSPDILVSSTSPALEPMTAISPGGAEQDEVVVFSLVHGPMGEDGTLQGLLELAGVAYVGAGVAGSAVAMDKGLAKGALAAAGIPQARYLFARDLEIDELWTKRVEAELGWPVFVKPANMGSSIGVTKAHDADELETALSEALRYDEYVIVEESIVGRELEVAVLGWPDLEASVPGELRPSHEFYDFEDKYLLGATQLTVPAEVSPEAMAELQSLAVAACRATRVDGMARVDFFWELDGRGPLVNEINTIPGFTPISMYPRLWAASGLPYPALIDRLVELAQRRRARRSRFETHRR